jgi:hypothetical protein
MELLNCEFGIIIYKYFTHLNPRLPTWTGCPNEPTLTPPFFNEGLGLVIFNLKALLMSLTTPPYGLPILEGRRGLY